MRDPALDAAFAFGLGRPTEQAQARKWSANPPTGTALAPCSGVPPRTRPSIDHHPSDPSARGHVLPVTDLTVLAVFGMIDAGWLGQITGKSAHSAGAPN
jgi:hypothetical protein